MADKLTVYVEAPGADKAAAAIEKVGTSAVNTNAKIAAIKPPNVLERVRQAAREFVKGYDEAAAQIEAAQTKRAAAAANKKGGFLSDAKGSLLGGLGLAGGAGALVGGAIATGVVVGTKAIIDLAVESENAKLKLEAVAKEGGQSFDVLAAKAEAFGNKVKLSNSEAQSTFAQLVNFANAAGRTDKIDEFTKRFSDLAAAKGINASQLGDISRQLNALTDEATDKLLNANPSAFYDKFAASLGKTAEQLTDAEKRAAVFDEVLRKGAIFDGTAEKRAAGLAGTLDELKKNIDDIGTAAGVAIGPLAKFLAQSVSTATTGKPGPELSELFVGFANNLFNGGQVGSDAFGEQNFLFEEKWKAIQKSILEGFNKAKSDIAAASADPDKNLVNFALKRFTGSDFLTLDPATQEKARTQAIADATQFLKVQKEVFEGVLKRNNTDERANAFSIFQGLKTVFTKAEAEKLFAGFSEAADKSFRQVLNKANVTVSELRRTLNAVSTDQQLNATARQSLTADFTASILRDVNAGRQKINELGKATDQVFADLFAKQGSGNPFVAIFTEAETSIERVRIATASLTQELRDQAVAIQSAQNADALFAARADNSVNVAGLRFDAARFRDGGTSDNDAAVNAFKRFRRANAEGLFRNNDNLRIFEASATGQTRLDLFNQRNALNEREGIFRNPAFVEEERRRLQRDVAAGSINGRLEAQLAALRNLRPEDQAQRDKINASIIALTQGAANSDLTEAGRNAAATAREQQATRFAAFEADAKTEREADRKIQQSIDKNIGDLLQIANKDGLTGVIRIINNAEDKAAVEIGKRPTAKDAKTLNEL